MLYNFTKAFTTHTFKYIKFLHTAKMSTKKHMQKSFFKRFFEVVCATVAFASITYGFFGSLVLTYFLIRSEIWFLMAIYLFWIWVLDIRILDRGGRDFEWVRNWKLWEYARNYFPVKLVIVSKIELDETKNYLFCCHPHGILPMGVALMFINHGKNNQKLQIRHRFYNFTLKINLMVPFLRELLLAMGFCNASTEGISYILNKPSGGNVGLLYPGGAAEAYNSSPGIYRLVLKNRKGFIKLALNNGYNIVPLFSFGEVDTFRQVDIKKFFLIRIIQDGFKYLSGLAPVVFFGRGYLSIPYRSPIHVVVGTPIYVAKKQNPSQQEIDTLHEEYIRQLGELFEEQKHRYLNNPNSTFLIID